mmetsp:Transcript_29728/g.53965  ORF Transcript_29728/g.53965 Transcript_29728/m.53965 type:complete len:215 (+) Transcript_29728:183-827(+)|eukprot:CAMPEP_0201883802 /NCGR_PEP_ID=MMETSP0902-20130614/16245_1 /ASSEMBLY_ACC=CAM_ASM_000551 /TAXON_ID=420261 /ORGANISM="Thalassiosira antarctica, Strain CCMP982" /LENGTH=214 /DNA_ID=CAMNT_0048412665 /DNA_START=135 /DNA_END=779 /DNA_ORIENTATION=-
MVFFFKTRCGEYTIFMGKDKFENEELIKYGTPEDCWFHVDDLSSAHVYLRLKPGMTLDDISEDCIMDCCSLVKANSIAGCKKSFVYIVYTRWKNLKKTSDMVEGQVGYHRPENVRRVKIEKNNTIVKQLEKTKKELYPDLAKEQQDRLSEIQAQKKAHRRAEEKAKKKEDLERAREKEEKSYDRIMGGEKMMSNTEMNATADASAAEEFEDDFM